MDFISNFFSPHHEEAERAYNQVQQTHHEGSLTHELIAGAGAFMAMRQYQNHLAEKGQPANHAFAKELLAAFAGAEVDKLIETKGLDAWDRQKAKQQAVQQANAMYDAQHGQPGYGGQPGYNPGYNGQSGNNGHGGDHCGEEHHRRHHCHHDDD